MRGDSGRRALRKIPSLSIDPAPDRCGLMLSTNPLYGAPSPVILDLWGVGFEIKRRVARDEIEAMRDWCNDALTAIDTADEAETTEREVA